MKNVLVRLLLLAWTIIGLVYVGVVLTYYYRLNKDESTLSDSEKEDILKKVQTLYQSIQLLSQQIQAKEQEVTQKLQADQAESVQKVVNELIKAKKIKLLLNSQALLAFDRSDEKVNLTPEVIDLINKEQKK